MRAKPGFYARNHIDKALFLRYSALFTALLAALLLYSPLFHLIFLSLKALYKARRRRQYAVVRRGGATQYRAL